VSEHTNSARSADRGSRRARPVSTKRGALAAIAVALILALLAVPAPARAVTCSGATPKRCDQTVDGGVATVCVPNNFECCNTRICAAACGASWKRCMNAGSDLAVCEDTAAMCTTAHGGDPNYPKFCEEFVMVTGSLTCGQPAEKPGNIGWCCEAGALCGEHFPECLCSLPCGNTCCQGEDECVEGFCKPPCPPGTHYEGQVCVCDEGQACGVGSRRVCCPDGSTCQGSRCVTPRQQDNPDDNPFQNFINMINQVAGSRGGRSGQGRVALAAPGPVDSVLLELAAVNGLRAAVGLALDAHAVDPAYQSNVVAGNGSLPALAAGTGLDPSAAAALDALLTAQGKGFAQALASTKALARSRGALRAHDLAAARKLAKAAGSFAGRAAKALRPVPKLRAKAVAALTSTGAAEVNTTPEEVAALQASVAPGDVPSDLAALLTGLGADADDLSRVGQALQNASAGGPALIAPLADEAQTASLKSMTKKLGRFAKSARRSPFGTVPGIE